MTQLWIWSFGESSQPSSKWPVQDDEQSTRCSGWATGHRDLLRPGISDFRWKFANAQSLQIAVVHHRVPQQRGRRTWNRQDRHCWEPIHRLEGNILYIENRWFEIWYYRQCFLTSCLAKFSREEFTSHPEPKSFTKLTKIWRFTYWTEKSWDSSHTWLIKCPITFTTVSNKLVYNF